MKTILAAASILAMASGAAMAQTTPSTTDKPAASGQGEKSEKMSPGTTGAMQNEAGATATSPQDVQKQGGMGVGAEGDKAGKTMGGGGGEKPK